MLTPSGKFCLTHTINPLGSRAVALTCLTKRGASLSGSSKHFSNSPRKKLSEPETWEGTGSELLMNWCWENTVFSVRVCVCAPPTLCASRRFGGCCQRRSCLSPSCHPGRPPPSSCSCSPEDGDTRAQWLTQSAPTLPQLEWQGVSKVI